mgnify:FL=1
MTHPLQTAATLRAARAVIADTPQHDDAALARACRKVIDHSRNPDERARAADLLALVQGEAA